MGSKFYKPVWSWNTDTDSILRKWIKGHTLNFPCGMSKLGNVRADKDERVNPDIKADLRAPEAHFKPRQFDTLICDPPFKMFNKFYWILPLINLARQRVIFSTPQIHLHLPKPWKLTDIFLTTQPGCLTFRIFQVFDRDSASLDSFL